jgi:hypothetical protein
MGREFCPHCGRACNIRVAVSRRRVVDAGGRAKKVCTKTVHCEECGTFVRSEDVPCPDANRGGAGESGA